MKMNMKIENYLCWLLSFLSKQVAFFLIEAKRKFHHQSKQR